MKIDRVDRIGLCDERGRAKEIMSTIQSGVDPTAGPKETGITRDDALDAHLAERELRPATVRGYTYDLNRYLKQFRRRAVADITRQDCRDLLETLTARHGRIAARHVTEPREDKRPSTSPHALRHHARTLMIAAGVPYAESALLLGQKLPGVSGGHVHPEHLAEALRLHSQALETLVLAEAHH